MEVETYEEYHADNVRRVAEISDEEREKIWPGTSPEALVEHFDRVDKHMNERNAYWNALAKQGEQFEKATEFYSLEELLEATTYIRGAWESQYEPSKIPNCPVCGNKLTLADTKDWVYACSSQEDDPDRPGWLRQREDYGTAYGVDYWEHYRRSQVTGLRPGNPDLLKFLTMLKRICGEPGTQTIPPP
jgi:hypothetical protein